MMARRVSRLWQISGGETSRRALRVCVVDSMPRAAIEHGYANRVIRSRRCPESIAALCNEGIKQPREEMVEASLEMQSGPE